MVLSGEGSDEIFRGYLYFQKAPDARAILFMRKRWGNSASWIYTIVCGQINRFAHGEWRTCSVSWQRIHGRSNESESFRQDGRVNGLEVDTPQGFWEGSAPQYFVASEGAIQWRMDTNGLTLWRSLWIKSDEQLSKAKFRFPVNPPMSKEEYYYRTIFSEHFPSDTAAACVPSTDWWLAVHRLRLEWDESFKKLNDPLGSVKNVHNKSYWSTSEYSTACLWNLEKLQT